MTMQTSPEINEIAAACAKAQAELENVGKDAVNPHFRSKYASLAAVMDAVRPVYAKHDIAIWQMPINGEGPNIGLTTRFAHSSGQWIESTLYVAPLKFDAQGAGSVITYCRRYALMAMAGVATDDDDGNAAVARPEAQPNGHAAYPQRPIKPAVAKEWNEPPPIEPPAHPETGETSPHIVPLPTRNGTGLPDWIAFGGKLIAAFKSAQSSGELAEWEYLNIGAINDMAGAAPRAHASVTAALQAARARLEPPLLPGEG